MFNCRKFMRVIVFFTGLLMLAAGAAAGPESAASAERPGRPVRVAYIEGGFYVDYVSIFVALAQGLAELGVIADGSVPPEEAAKGTAAVWQWLSANAGGEDIEFVRDGYYSAGWGDAAFAGKRAELVTRLNKTKDIDLVLAFGTKAGRAMASDEHNTPVVILSVTDAVAAGIVSSAGDSGRGHVFAMVQHNRTHREVTLFHDIFRFKKLGIAYEDSDGGRASIALAQILNAARESDFELVTCTDTLFHGNRAVATANLRACHERLIDAGAEAVYMTVNNGMQPDLMSDILRPLLEARVPTFSQNGVDEVRRGVLLGISQTSFSGQGMFAARAVRNIINGESPRAQNQIYEEPLSLAVNLHTAMLIGWNPSLAVLAAVDEIFQGQ